MIGGLLDDTRRLDSMYKTAGDGYRLDAQGSVMGGLPQYKQAQQQQLSGLLGIIPVGMAKPSDNLAKYAEKLGYAVKRENSALSDSEYLMLSHPQLQKELKVRVSDHNLPTSYKQKHGEADFEVTTNGPREDAGNSWFNTVGLLARELNQDPPKQISSLIERYGRPLPTQDAYNKTLERIAQENALAIQERSIRLAQERPIIEASFAARKEKQQQLALQYSEKYGVPQDVFLSQTLDHRPIKQALGISNSQSAQIMNDFKNALDN